VRPRPPISFSAHRGPQPNVLAIVLAGGEGRRLQPLTAERAKPAVPIGGRYRLVDFVLSNLVNSGLFKIKVLTQYKSDSLNTHIARGWRLPAMLDFYVDLVPAQQRTGKDWYKGSADAMYQSLHTITDEDPDYVAVFGGDHMYKMDVRQMVDYHIEKHADATVAAIPVPASEAHAFGVLAVDEQQRVVAFDEKPSRPREIPGRPGWVLASMGNYLFTTETLVAEVRRDAESSGSSHDFGRNIIPALVGGPREVYAYDFATNQIPGQPEHERGYWRDVGTIASYWQANMDLLAVSPTFDLYNPRWPIRTWALPLPPAKFVFADEAQARVGVATDSLVCEGCIVSGGRIDRTILGPSSRVNSFAHVEESIIFDGVDVGRHARLRRVIVDKNVEIPAKIEIGFDLETDQRRFPVVDGIVVIPKETRIPERVQVSVPSDSDSAHDSA
jgi:glucose-1-phosphate adenylyltransferase